MLLEMTPGGKSKTPFLGTFADEVGDGLVDGWIIA